MRTKRFESFLKEEIVRKGSEEIQSTRTFDEVGYKARPIGVQLDFATGARVMLQIVRASPPGGDDFSQAERPVEGAILEPVRGVDLPVEGGKIRVKDVEIYLVALITNSGSSEIDNVRSFARHKQRLGIDVAFHNGGHCYVHFLYTLPKGKDLSFHPEFNVLEVI